MDGVFAFKAVVLIAVFAIGVWALHALGLVSTIEVAASFTLVACVFGGASCTALRTGFTLRDIIGKGFGTAVFHAL